MMSDRKRKALVDLLEDPDERIYLVIKQVIKSEGQFIVPMLTQVITNEKSIPLQYHRAQEILYAIRLEGISQEFLNWKDSSDKDLLKAIITLTKLIDPRLDEAFVNKQMESIRKDVWLELNDYQTAFEQVKILNHIFFDIHGFECESSFQRNLEHLNIGTVLAEKKGNPLIIGLIYSIIANWLEVPIYGVDFPKIFILARMDENNTSFFSDTESKYGVLFYINPIGKGIVFDEQEIRTFLKQIEMEPERKFFEPTSNTNLIQRYLLAFEEACHFKGDAEGLEALSQIKSIF
jgi:regulator of sirC expression with transglutaminase-like and TPR domain